MGLTAGALVGRLTLVLTHPGYLGVDGGAYILSAHVQLGLPTFGTDFTRPPLAPGWLLVPFLNLFGYDVGYKVFAALGSLLLIGPFWLLARLFLSPSQAVFALAFLLVDLLHAEMLVTGVLPLMAFAPLLLVLWGVLRLSVTGWAWRYAAAVVVGLPLVAYVNQTTAGITAVILPVLVLFLWRSAGWRSVRRLLAPVGLGVALAATALPWYLELAPGSAKMHFDGPWLLLSGWGSSAWWQFGLAAVVGIWLWRTNRETLWRALAVLILSLGFLLVWLSYDETVINLFYRSRYLLPLVWYIGAARLVFQHWWGHVPRVLRTAGLGLAFAGMVGLFIVQFNGQATYSDMVTPETARALAVIPDGSGGIITNSYMFSLWVVGLKQMPSAWTFTAPPPRAYAERYEDTRCLLGWIAGCDVAAARAALAGYEWLLLETRFPYYNRRAPPVWGAPAAPWQGADALPWLQLKYAEGTTRLYRIL